MCKLGILVFVCFFGAHNFRHCLLWLQINFLWLSSYFWTKISDFDLLHFRSANWGFFVPRTTDIAYFRYKLNFYDSIAISWPKFQILVCCTLGMQIGCFDICLFLVPKTFDIDYFGYKWTFYDSLGISWQKYEILVCRTLGFKLEFLVFICSLEPSTSNIAYFVLPINFLWPNRYFLTKIWDFG